VAGETRVIARVTMVQAASGDDGVGVGDGDGRAGNVGGSGQGSMDATAA